MACGRRGRMSSAKPSRGRCRLDFVRLGRVVAERRAEAHPAPQRAATTAWFSPLPPGARDGAADQRLAGQRQARHGQAQIQSRIAYDDDASRHSHVGARKASTLHRTALPAKRAGRSLS